MKKTLLLLMCLVGAFTCAWSQTTVTLVSDGSSAEGIKPTLNDDATEAVWNCDAFTMTQKKNKSSNPVVITYAEIRVYASHSLVFTPAAGYEIEKVVATAGGTTYANELGAGSLANCTKTVNGKEVTIVPNNPAEAFTLTNSAQSRLTKVEVTYKAATIRTEGTVTFNGEEVYNATLGQPFTAPTATTNSDAAIKYESSNPECATVNAQTGAVTLVGAGVTVITASVEMTDNFTAASASYKINVTDPNLTFLNFQGWEFPGADDWTSSYAEHIVEFTEATVTFDSANKQGAGSSIDDCPVTKGQPITLVLTDKTKNIATLSATFEQWASKDQTITLEISPDGVNFETVSKTSEFKFNNIQLWEGVVAVRFTFSSQNNQVGLANISLSLAEASNDPVIYADEFVEFGESLGGFDPKTLKVAAVNCTDPVTYKLSGEDADVFTVTGNLTAEGGELTINCTATEVGYYLALLTLSSTDAHDVEVYLSANVIELPGVGEGTALNPYDVTRAIAVIDNGLNTTDNVYVKGTISKVSSYNDSYHSISYWLDDNAFQAFSGKGINGADFEAKEDLAVGDEVVICGVIKKYNTTYELDKDNYIVAINYAEAYPVTFTANGMATFSATKAAIFDDNTPVKAYIATRVEDNTVYMDRVTGTIAANTGLVLMAEEGTVAIELTDAAGTTPDNNLMQPWAPLTTVAASDNTTSNYVLGSLDGVFGFYFLAAEVTNNTGQGRACLKANATAGQQLKIRFNDGATTTELEVSPEVFDAIMYNINGVQVDGGYKGIVIKNGKKYINK